MQTVHSITRRSALVLSALVLGPALILSSPSSTSRLVPDRPIHDQVCVVIRNGVATAVACPSVADVWFGSSRERELAGAPICWWTAPPSRLSGIRGVGAATARRLAEFRDDGGLPLDGPLQSIRGVGPRLAASITDAVTRRCPMTSP